MPRNSQRCGLGKGACLSQRLRFKRSISRKLLWYNYFEFTSEILLVICVLLFLLRFLHTVPVQFECFSYDRRGKVVTLLYSI